MKLAILEDRPWIMMSMLREIREILPSEEISLLYYVNPITRLEESITKMEPECEKLGVGLTMIFENEFESKIEELYADIERIFFFDLVLDDNADFFEERINVKFAEEKKADKRIWFYTTSGKYNVSKIMEEFEDQYIPVSNYDADRDEIIFDIETVKEILKKHQGS